MCSNTLDCPLDLQLVVNWLKPNVTFSVHIKILKTEFDLLYFLSNSQSMWIQLFNLPQIVTEIINDIAAIIIITTALCKTAISLDMVSLAVCKQWTHNKINDTSQSNSTNSTEELSCFKQSSALSFLTTL